MSTSELSSWRSLLGFHVQRSTRNEPRYAAHDAVTIFRQPGFGVIAASVYGEFVDRSNSGCRIRHRFGDLPVDECVSLVWRAENEIARVVWNRSIAGVTETGFQYL